MPPFAILSGHVRGKGFPATELPERLLQGIGWTPTNIMISALGPIWDTPFGTARDLMLLPDPATEVRVDFDDGSPPEHLILGNLCATDGSPWECLSARFFASSPVSYLRLMPNRWAPTSANIAIRTALPACGLVQPSVAMMPWPSRLSSMSNIVRPTPPASPYLALGAITFVGVEGLRRKLGFASPLTHQPETVSERFVANSPAPPCRDHSMPPSMPSRRWAKHLTGSRRLISTPTSAPSERKQPT